MTRDGTAVSARPHSKARTGTGNKKKHVSFFQLTTGRIGNHTRLIHNLAVSADHPSIHANIKYYFNFQRISADRLLLCLRFITDLRVGFEK